MKNNQTLSIVPELPSIINLTEQEEFSKKDIKQAKNNNFEEIIKSRYENIYKVFRDDFPFFKDNHSNLELLAEFDNISKEFTELNGWLETLYKDYSDYKDWKYATISLTPIKTPSGLIYHFKGILEWTNGEFNNRATPLSVVPVYGIPSGKIIKLNSTNTRDSKMFDYAKIEYRSLDLKLGEE